MTRDADRQAPPSFAAGPQPADPQALLRAWRAKGADAADPVRFRFLEALAARAAQQDGQARRVLDARLATLLAQYRDAWSRSHGASAAARDAAGSRAPLRALAELVAHAARHAAPAGAQRAAGAVAAPEELKAVRYFRSTWSRLSADRRLTQALAKVPENAGPLNSNHLVHRTLMVMRELSPEYLNRFVTYVDALLWLDQARAGAFEAKAAPVRGDGEKKPTRQRGG